MKWGNVQEYFLGTRKNICICEQLNLKQNDVFSAYVNGTRPNTVMHRRDLRLFVRDAIKAANCCIANVGTLAIVSVNFLISHKYFHQPNEQLT